MDTINAKYLASGPVLSEEETILHLSYYRAGKQSSRETLLLGHTRLVYSVVRKFLHIGHDPEDLFQIGCIGLLKAIDRFDLELGVKLSTYAVPLIIGEIRRYLRDDGPIKVSRDLKDKAFKARKCQDRLRAELGREARLGEIAAALQSTEEEIVFALDAMRPPTSLAERVNKGDESSPHLVDSMQVPQAEGDSTIEGLAIKQVIASLPMKERRIIYARYFENRTQSQIAAELGVSQVQVSRLEKVILSRLRKLLI